MKFMGGKLIPKLSRDADLDPDGRVDISIILSDTGCEDVYWNELTRKSSMAGFYNLFHFI
jgi:hypothetical protein